MRNTTIVTAAALALAVTLPAVSAQAQVQAPRTFVSAAGSDINPCSFALPCRHFQAAVNLTSVGGEVDALDPAGYGPITISHAITIEGQGWSYIAPPTGGNGIMINAVSGDVKIRGVSLNGVGVANSGEGIQFFSGGSLTVTNCVVENFGVDGIGFFPSSSSKLFVSNTMVSDNGRDGIEIDPGSSGSTNGVLNHVELLNNAQNGLTVTTTSSQTVNVTISDSVSTNNTNSGVSAISFSGTPVNVMVRETTSANNGINGLAASGAGAILRVTRSTITGNVTGWAASAPGVVLSYADNNIDGNTSINTEPPGPLVYH